MATYRDLNVYTKKVEEEGLLPQREIFKQWIRVVSELCREQSISFMSLSRGDAIILNGVELGTRSTERMQNFLKWAKDNGSNVV